MLADPAVPLPRDFFGRPAVEVAPGLLGCVLAHETAAGLVAVRLTEVEAYEGMADPASHAYRGQTTRNAVMFGPAGYAYVYFTYGMHFCVNLVCLPAGTAAAVLLRAGEVIAGETLASQRRAGGERGGSAAASQRRSGGERGGNAAARSRRPAARAFRDLARGPARLCQALGIERSMNGADVCDPGSPLRILPGRPVPAPRIATGPRVGVREGADVPWRFWLDGDPAVSAYRHHTPRKRASGAR